MSGNDDAMMVTEIESDLGLGPYLRWIWLTRWQVLASIPQGRLGPFMHFHGKKRSSPRCVWGEVAGTLGRGDKTTMKEVPESQGQQVVVQTLQYYVPLFCMI